MPSSCIIIHLFYLSAINSIYAYDDWGLQPDTSRIVKRQAGGCKQNEYKCINGQCIGNLSVCDGTQDCADGSDETTTQCISPIKCGQPITKDVKPLVTSRRVPTVGEYPWHAGIYTEYDGNWDLICGGTLISPHIVLTAAHCVYKDFQEIPKARDVREIKVAVGKFNRSWDIQDPYQQTRNVSEIVLPLRYRGMKNNYVGDIALLDLVSNVALNDYVLPACIDKGINGFYIPEKGTIGSIAGWGLTEEKTLDTKLHSLHLPYLDYISCLDELPRDFVRFLTHDKFCAGYKNGTGVQPGDAGGGLTFIKNNRHFVYGISSLKSATDDTYCLFTNVSEHIGWLEDAMRRLSQKLGRIQ